MFTTGGKMDGAFCPDSTFQRASEFQTPSFGSFMNW